MRRITQGGCQENDFRLRSVASAPQTIHTSGRLSLSTSSRSNRTVAMPGPSMTALQEDLSRDRVSRDDPSFPAWRRQKKSAGCVRWLGESVPLRWRRGLLQLQAEVIVQYPFRPVPPGVRQLEDVCARFQQGGVERHLLFLPVAADTVAMHYA